MHEAEKRLAEWIIKVRPLPCFQHPSIFYLILSPEAVLIALTSGWLLLQTVVVEENGQTGVIAQEEE
ncbi:hypothetical protein BTVI_45032 [Pitangus sulphuratus]|nr:hypothetical protein BTVI_45032 [Pitangus sulphuratus]